MKSRIITYLFLLLLAACKKDYCPIEITTSVSEPTTQAMSVTYSTTVTRPAHVFIIDFENKGYSQIIGNTTDAPFINSLVPKATLFTKFYALYHPSYPNYFALFSGSNQGVTSDDCIDVTNRTGKNLYTTLKAVGKTFRQYSEGLPAAGSTICKYGYYVERHNPVTIFSNVPQTSVNLPLSALNLKDSTTFKNAATVVNIAPNVLHDMHDGSSTSDRIKRGDAWLKANCALLMDWSLKNNSIVILWYDEDSKTEGNRVPVMFLGQHIRQGIKISTSYNHYSLCKSLQYWYGAENAYTGNLKNVTVMNGFWK